MKLTPFQFYVQKILPLAMDDSLSYYETLLKVRNKLNDVITAQNSLSDNFENVKQALTEIQEYVEEYFETLDLTEETRETLREMVDSGQFSEIATHILATYFNPFFVNSSTEMQFTAGCWTMETDGVNNVYWYLDGSLYNSKLVFKGYVNTTNDLPESPETGRDAYVVTADNNLYVFDGVQNAWVNQELFYNGQIASPVEAIHAYAIYVLKSNSHVYAFDTQTQAYADTGIIYGLSADDWQYRGFLGNGASISSITQVGWYGYTFTAIPADFPQTLTGKSGYLLVYNTGASTKYIRLVSNKNEIHEYNNGTWVYIPNNGDYPNEWYTTGHNWTMQQLATVQRNSFGTTPQNGTWRPQSAVYNPSDSTVILLLASSNPADNNALVKIYNAATVQTLTINFAKNNAMASWQIAAGHVNACALDEINQILYICSGGTPDGAFSTNISPNTLFKLDLSTRSLSSYTVTGLSYLNSLFWIGAELYACDYTYIYKLSGENYTTATRVTGLNVSKSNFYNAERNWKNETLFNQMEFSDGTTLYKTMYGCNNSNTINCALIVSYDITAKTEINRQFIPMPVRDELEGGFFINDTLLFFTDGYFPSLYQCFSELPEMNQSVDKIPALMTDYGNLNYMLSSGVYYFTNSATQSNGLTNKPSNAPSTSCSLIVEHLGGTACIQKLTYINNGNEIAVYTRKTYNNTFYPWEKQPDTRGVSDLTDRLPVIIPEPVKMWALESLSSNITAIQSICRDTDENKYYISACGTASNGLTILVQTDEFFNIENTYTFTAGHANDICYNPVTKSIIILNGSTTDPETSQPTSMWDGHHANTVTVFSTETREVTQQFVVNESSSVSSDVWLNAIDYYNGNYYCHGYGYFTIFDSNFTVKQRIPMNIENYVPELANSESRYTQTLALSYPYVYMVYTVIHQLSPALELQNALSEGCIAKFNLLNNSLTFCGASFFQMLQNSEMEAITINDDGSFYLLTNGWYAKLYHANINFPAERNRIVQLTTDTDLDDLTAPGLYICSSGTTAASLLHTPETLTAGCTVETRLIGVGHLLQILYHPGTIYNYKIWTRYNVNNGGWRDWNRIANYTEALPNLNANAETYQHYISHMVMNGCYYISHTASNAWLDAPPENPTIYYKLTVTKYTSTTVQQELVNISTGKTWYRYVDINTFTPADTWLSGDNAPQTNLSGIASFHSNNLANIKYNTTFIANYTGTTGGWTDIPVANKNYAFFSCRTSANNMQQFLIESTTGRLFTRRIERAAATPAYNWVEFIQKSEFDALEARVAALENP